MFPPTDQCAIVSALALGIGASTAIFSVVDTVLLKPLPYPQSDLIVRIGAGRGRMVRQLLTESLMPAAGVTLGLLIGGPGVQALLAINPGNIPLKPGEPSVFTAVALLLAFIAILASYLPARRAVRIDPIVALRYE